MPLARSEHLEERRGRRRRRENECSVRKGGEEYEVMGVGEGRGKTKDARLKKATNAHTYGHTWI